VNIPRPYKDGASVALVFMLVAAALVEARPLWLDEILQLMMTRMPSAGEMLGEIPKNLGASPLGYLIQQATLRVTGFSMAYARLPEVLFGGGAVFIVALLADALGMRWPWVSASLFALFPLTLRYADESRIYAPALFFSVLATYLYLRMAKSPRLWTATPYTLALVAAVYTQPYALSVGLAHVAWSATEKDRKATAAGVLCLFAAGAAYLPWFLWSRSVWTRVIHEQGLQFSFSPHLLAMTFREILGAGYWGSGMLLILACFAVMRGTLEARTRNLLGLLILLPLIVGLAADAWFGYVFAVRQFLWVLPALALTGAAAIETRRRGAFVVAGLLAGICVMQSYKYFTSPSENWQAASVTAQKEVGADGCFRSVPDDHVRYYAFFEPELKKRTCWAAAPRVVLAISPDGTAEEWQRTIHQLTFDGYANPQETTDGKFRILTFIRP